MRISDWSSDVCSSDLNTYPGAACDVQSHLYSYSFEPKHDWTRKFGLQVEIRQYMEDCVRKYGLAAHLRFHQEVVSAEFDRARGLWKITTADGQERHAQTLVTNGKASWRARGGQYVVISGVAL